jgi:hypothetical protein
MTTSPKAVGGGSSAVAASAHAACARFRGTDPLITGLSRRTLAATLKHPDTLGTIPEARWMRAMTFERLVRDPRFASEVATTVAGRLGLERPSAVVIADAHVDTRQTAALLDAAHERAVDAGAATLIHGLAVPFVGFEGEAATEVKPDFAVVAAKDDRRGSWLIVGDAKDYERMRSRIDDARLLKGFLQVAVGAESCDAWTRLPDGMDVHRFGALAVPRNAFLQPEVVIEDLDDHRLEVSLKVRERREEAGRFEQLPDRPLDEFVAHLKATFDPTSCATCTLFGYCRNELRNSQDLEDLLIELGVPPEFWPQVRGLVDGSGEVGSAPPSLVARITASATCKGQTTGQRRIDPAGLPGTVNFVIAKSDSSVLGVHGLAVQRVSANGPGDWTEIVFEEPQSPATRQAVMKAVGADIGAALAEMRKANPENPDPVHLVVPDRPTADILVSIADNLAGVELSRLRWQRDKDMGRPPVTFNGDPAVMPKPLREPARTGVSFLLEEDRARVLKVRCPVVDLGAALRRHLTAGGPEVNAFRLDYLTAWADPAKTVNHRALSDAIEESEHTPGARLSNKMSDKIHVALVGQGKRHDHTKAADPKLYADLVTADLRYKEETLQQALDALDATNDSNLRAAYRAIEGDSQTIWRRRRELHASDLVRFGRTYRWWRNNQVTAVESDANCEKQLLALTNEHGAAGGAASAGTRNLAFANVVGVDPIVIDLESRGIAGEDRIVLLHGPLGASVEEPTIQTRLQKGSVRIEGLSIGPLTRGGLPPSAPPRRFVWEPQAVPSLSIGDRIVVSNFDWFSTNTGNKFLNVAKPDLDRNSAPTEDCEPESYDLDPEAHKYCCRSHETAEADWADELAARRHRGELNPQTWPPVVDEDAFEVTAYGAAVGNPDAEEQVPVPDDITIDDLE